MSETPRQIDIKGPVSGQIAIGNYINQFQNLNGCTINIASPDQQPVWERKQRPMTGRPRPPSLFLDREPEIQLVENSLQSFQPVNVSGVAGIGKSTLLKRLVHILRPEQFVDGIHYLHAYNRKMEDLLQDLFSTFYTSNRAAIPNRAQLQGFLQELTALLVIDDIDLNPDEIQVMLDMAPNCMFVVASTQQILRSGLRTVRLGRLPESDAVTLFESALGRVLNENERQIVCEISAMLKGHPQSLYWLAATTRQDGLILAEVREKLRVMSMQGLLQESIQSLSDRQKKILAMLTAIESRPLTQAHIAALLPGEPVQAALNALTARGLIQTQNQSSRISESFAGELAQSWRLGQWEQAITRYFVNWLAQKPSLRAIEEVKDTLWILMEKAAQRRDWSAVISLGRTLEHLFIISGYWHAWYEVLQYLLGAARNLADHHLEGWVLHQLGSRSLCLGATNQASSFLQQAAAIRKSIGDHAGLQITQHNLSIVTGLAPVTATSAATTALSIKPLVVAVTGLAGVIAVGVGIAVLGSLYTPQPPALIGPTHQYIQSSEQYPAFVWAGVFGGSTYEIQVDDQPDFSSPLLDQILAETSLAPGLPIGQGIYYWRVRANSRSGRQGNWSETWQFVISIPPVPPSLLQPPDQSVNTSPTPLTFLWTSVQNAASYQIQIDDNADFSSPLEDTPVPGTQYSSASALERGIFGWRVRALNSLNQPGDWSQTWIFTISITPGSLQLIEPANGSKLETTTTPNFNWHTVNNAVEYEIQVDDNPDFSSPQYDARQVESSFPIQAPLSQGSYSWRVRAFNEDERSGDWSETWNFIISIPPAVPTLSLPTDGTQAAINDMPPFSWTPVENAANYEVQVDDSQNFDSPNFGTRTTSTSYRLTGSLDQGLYYWRVRALNAYDTASAWSAPWKLTIVLPPDPPLLKSPGRDTQFESTKLMAFAWQGVPTAAQYQIQVDNTPNFSSPEFQTSAAVTSITANQYFQTGQYSWRVRSLTNNSIAGAWSEVWNFSVQLPGPILLSPSNNSTDSTSPPTFSWSSVQNASRYQVQIDEDQYFSSPVVDQQTTSRTVSIPDTLTPGNHQCQVDYYYPYYWRVRALDSGGVQGPWSLIWKVTIHFYISLC